jgi:DNA-binding LacI/PurR family transcriptional regulator
MGAVRSASRGVVMVDVARRAGVSQKTVSRVVNNAPYVRPDVRDKVNAVIEELGYRPNVAARALARQRTHAIGMLVVGASLSGPARRLFSVDQAARRHGYTVALATVPDLDPASVGEGVESLLDRGVEGLVIEVPSHLARFDIGLLADLPIITSAGRIAGLPRQTVVDVDQAASAHEATSYLLGLGHRTVFHIAGPRDWDAAEKRRQGWRSALTAAGAPVPRVLFGDWSPRAGYRLGRRLAARGEVTAIFVANDHMAMGVLRALAEAGRRVPEDVSVFGYDDVPEAEFQMVPLSTVAIDADGAAERILSELVAMIEGAEPAPEPIELGSRLVLRSSTGPAPDGRSRPGDP